MNMNLGPSSLTVSVHPHQYSSLSVPGDTVKLTHQKILKTDPAPLFKLFILFYLKTIHPIIPQLAIIFHIKESFWGTENIAFCTTRHSHPIPFFKVPTVGRLLHLPAMKPDNWGTSNQKPIEGVCTQYMSSFLKWRSMGWTWWNRYEQKNGWAI